MLLKIVGALIAVVSSAGLGLYYAGRMRRRVAELEDLLRVLAVIRSEVSFRLSARAEVFRLATQSAHTAVRKIFADPPAFDELALCAEERQIIEDFLRSFGTVDYDTQIRSIDQCGARLGGILDEARADYCRRARLVRALCPMAAGALCLLLF